MKSFLVVIFTSLSTIIFAQDGTLDSSFGVSGYTFNQSIANKSYYYKSLAKQDDGKILQAGVVISGQDSNVFLSRMFNNGSLDTAFANLGYFEHGDILSHTKAQKVLVLPNDKILVGANHLSAGINSFLLMKLNVNGGLDSSFGNNGVVNISSSGKALKNILLQSTGKIIIQADSFLYRLNANGGIDITFGNLGKLDVGTLSLFVIQKDDKIVGINNKHLLVSRFLPNGSIDSAYAVNGTYYKNTTTNLPPATPAISYLIRSAVLDSLGGLVFYADWSYIFGVSVTKGYLISRLTNAGVRDSVYERNKQETSGPSNYDPFATSPSTFLLLQGNQKPVKVQMCLIEYTKNVLLLKRFYQRPYFGTDTSFNHKGWCIANYPNNNRIDNKEPGDALILDDSSILVLAKFGNGSNSFVCKFKTSQYSYQPQAPLARIGFSQTIGAVNVSKIQLFDSSLYYPTSRIWTITPGNYQFQDGTTNTSQNPKIIFTQTGTYTIKLVVLNAIGKDSTIINQAIDIGNNPVANFGATALVSDTSMLLGLIDSSLYNPAYRKWTISAPNFVFVNSSDTSANPNVRFTQSGFYTIKLWVKSVYGVDSITKQNYITVVNTSAPVANFESDKQQVRQDSLVRFFDKSIFTPQSRWWVFSPSTVQYLQGTDSSSVNPLVKFNAVGNYTVKLIVSNSQGVDSLIKNNYIQVGLPPQANFGVSQTIGTPGTELEIVDSSLNQVVSREWLITPDTYTITQGNLASTTLRVRFDSIGLYTIKLKVANYYGVDSIMKNNIVDIGLKPQANFGVSQTQGTSGTEVDIVDSSLNQVDSREWGIIPNTFTYIIGNNSSSSIRVRLDSAGSYSIKLRVQNKYGADSLQKNNSINIIPVGLIHYDLIHPMINVFPNPTNNKFTLSWGKLNVQEILLIDRLGSEIKRIIPEQSLDTITVDVTNIDDGVYVILLKTEKGNIIRKITLSAHY